MLALVYMMTSSNGKNVRVTGHLCGEFTGHRWIPHTKASDAELWCFFDLRPNKRLSKQSWVWWFKTPLCPLWRHCNDQYTFMYSTCYNNNTTAIVAGFLATRYKTSVVEFITWQGDQVRPGTYNTTSRAMHAHYVTGGSRIMLSKYTLSVLIKGLSALTHEIKCRTWWRHQMETFSAFLALRAGSSLVTGEFPSSAQWRRALMFSLICAWISDWVNNRNTGDLRRHQAHYDDTVMTQC